MLDIDNLLWISSPNFHARKGHPITKIVIHAMVGTMQGSINTFKNKNTQVSAHYLVGRDGSVIQMVKDQDAAFHVCNANDFCLGIEHEDMFKNATDKRLIGGCMGKLVWWTAQELDISAQLVSQLVKKWNLKITDIIGHNDPYLRQFKNNHQDPGPLFPWKEYLQQVQHYLDILHGETKK